MKKLSVIIPAYNVNKYIEECVYSVTRQSYDNLEIIVINDGSKDKTAELLDRLKDEDSRIIVIHQENGGLSQARNVGLSLFTGEYVMFLDSDDWLEEDCCEIAIKELETFEADIVFFDYYKEFQKKQVQYHAYNDETIIYEKEKIDNLYLYNMRTITAWGKIYKREIIGLTRFDENMRTAEDVDFNYRVYENVRKAVYINKLLLHYRILPKSAIHGYDAAVLEKFQYPINQIRKYMISNDCKKLRAYYSFCAIAYMVICQNGICHDSSKNIWQKAREIQKLKHIDFVQELLENIDKVSVPFSRKILLYLGKLNCAIGVVAIIEIKRKAEKNG